MKRDIRLYLDDILESIGRIEEYTKGITEEEFSRNQQTQDAVLRRLAIIGEAIKQLPGELREENKQIPWKTIAGARDIFVHEYFGVSLDRVWATIVEDFPEFKKQIETLLKQQGLS